MLCNTTIYTYIQIQNYADVSQEKCNMIKYFLVLVITFNYNKNHIQKESQRIRTYLYIFKFYKQHPRNNTHCQPV